MYTISYFKDLISQAGDGAVANWQQLAAYLSSPEGGQFRIIDGTDIYQNYAIVRYDKGISNMTLPYSRWLRSVVWDKTKCLPVCVAPPKASAAETFNQEILQTTVCEEFLDGVMINVFGVVGSDAEPVVCTRSSLGAAGNFYSQRPFSSLLKDALTASNWTIKDLLPAGEEGRTVFASVLLQHPEHRIVESVAVPRIFIIHQGIVADDGTVVIDESQSKAPRLGCELSFADLPRWLGQKAEELGWTWQGVVFKDGKGGRWRMRAAPYRLVRSLRGITSRSDVRFAYLRQQNLLESYLYYYPEDLTLYMQYEMRIEKIKQEIYDTYVAVYITKVLSYDHISPAVKAILYNLHGYYLNVLRPVKKYIKKTDVGLLLGALNWQQLLRLLLESISHSPPFTMEIQRRRSRVTDVILTANADHV